MDHPQENGSYTCSFTPCSKYVSAFHARFGHGQKFRLNNSRVCSEACFRAQFLLLAEYWLKQDLNIPISERRQKLGLMLLEARIITSEQLEIVIELQKSNQKRRVGDLAQELGYATEQQITHMLSRQEGLPWLDADLEQLPAVVLARVPPEIAVTSLIAPLEYNSILNEITVISASPVDRLGINALEKMGHCCVNVFIGPESKVRRAIAHYYGAPLALRTARSSIQKENEELAALAEGVCHFYRAASATNLEVARCRELLWLRAYNVGNQYDWYVLLEPVSEGMLFEWRGNAKTANLSR